MAPGCHLTPAADRKLGLVAHRRKPVAADRQPPARAACFTCFIRSLSGGPCLRPHFLAASPSPASSSRQSPLLASFDPVNVEYDYSNCVFLITEHRNPHDTKPTNDSHLGSPVTPAKARARAAEKVPTAPDARFRGHDEEGTGY